MKAGRTDLLWQVLREMVQHLIGNQKLTIGTLSDLKKQKLRMYYGYRKPKNSPS